MTLIVSFIFFSFFFAFFIFYLLQIELEKQGGLIQKSEEFLHSDRRSFRYTLPTRIDNSFVDYSNWIASSWVLPIKKDQKKSKIPEDDVFSTAAEATIVITTTANTTSLDYDSDLIDEYGWVQIDDRYYNVEANTYG